MSPEITKVAVLGAGVMGATIAAHLVNTGFEVLLLDLQVEKNGKKTNLADAAVASMKKAKPSPIYTSKWLGKIATGNFDEHMGQLKDCQWVIEVVVENLAIKKSLFDKVVPNMGPEAILTTNTSGIPIGDLNETLPETIRPRFFGTHFFNPPRYMKLLEVIPGPDTKPEYMEWAREFGETALGKGVVFAKDRPNFIANRIGVMAMMAVFPIMKEEEYSIEEVDKLMGPLTGRPKSAVFRTADMVGLDTFAHVADNLYEAVPEDERRDLFKLPEPVRQMIEKGYLGQKSKAGFYKREKDADGKASFYTIDLESMTYRDKAKVKFPSLDLLKGIEDVKERLKKTCMSPDRVGKFVWRAMSEMMVYSVNRIGEVADDVVNIDRAMKWGFNWELGPFETWDALGVESVAKRLQKEGREVPKLVQQMLEKGATSFYKMDSPNPQYLDVVDFTYKPVAERPNVLILEDYKKGENRVVKSNPGATLIDLGDGIACLEFHSKMNAIGQDTIAMTQYAVQTAEKDFDGLIVANQGEHFSAGANIMMILMAAQEGEWEDIDVMVRAFQAATSSLRYCKVPTVVAPHSLTLGGGCEFTIHGDAVQAAAETYIGLVEVGVGLLPAGGGTKEMLLRHVAAAARRGEQDLLPYVRKAFEIIGMAKVATSAVEAQEHLFLKETDGITINGDALITAAKNRCLGMAKTGYTPPKPPTDIPAAGEPAFSALKLGLYMMQEAGYISEHDNKIGTQIARILTGGALTPGSTMTEQHVLDLEREGFLSLCGERKTLERIQHMLTKGKPLRN